MKYLRPAISFAAMVLVMLAAMSADAQTSVRSPVAVNGVAAGFVCDTANGWVVTTDAAGRFQCTQSVANATNATNATNAQNAVNAVNATTATQAQTLNPNAQVNASQISGVISANNLPASGSGGGGTGVLPGCTNPNNGAYYANGGSYTVCQSYSAESGDCTSTRTFTCNAGSWN